ncbi:ricin-type beta-trefoil lectin domain protein [Streptomyces sp. NPDC048384]|uniref:ricin-type beta-trefoil lectin domain protein n=1 Tax=Streptomyces sp. NPDC048384 TaxID=3155487 RepID=UPI00342799DD
MRQVATRLCLTVPNDQPVMKPCAAADRAAYWRVDSRMGQIKINLTKKCLARMTNDRVNTAACTGGDSQLWYTNF